MPTRSPSRTHSLGLPLAALALAATARTADAAPLHPCVGAELAVSALHEAPEATDTLPPTRVLSIPVDAPMPRQMVQVTKVARIGGAERLVTADEMNRVYIQDIQTGELVEHGQFFPETSYSLPKLTDVAVSTGGEHMILAGQNFLALTPVKSKVSPLPGGGGFSDGLRQIDTHFKLRAAGAHEFFMVHQPIKAVWSSDDRAVLTSSTDMQGKSYLRIWDPVTLEQVHAFEPRGRFIDSESPNLGLSADGKTAFALTSEGIELFDLATKQPAAALTVPEGYKVTSGALSPDQRGALLALRTPAGSFVALIDVASGMMTANFRIPPRASVSHLQFSTDKTRVIALVDNAVYQWSVATGQLVKVTTFLADGIRPQISSQMFRRSPVYVDDRFMMVPSPGKIQFLPAGANGIGTSLPISPGGDVMVYGLAP